MLLLLLLLAKWKGREKVSINFFIFSLFARVSTNSSPLQLECFSQDMYFYIILFRGKMKTHRCLLINQTKNTCHILMLQMHFSIKYVNILQRILNWLTVGVCVAVTIWCRRLQVNWIKYCKYSYWNKYSQIKIKYFGWRCLSVDVFLWRKESVNIIIELNVIALN